MPTCYPREGPPLPGESLREYIDRTICHHRRLTPQGLCEAREMSRFLEPSWVITAGWACLHYERRQ